MKIKQEKIILRIKTHKDSLKNTKIKIDNNDDDIKALK